MTQSQNKDISQLANLLISKHGELKFTFDDLDALDFNDIIYEIPKDLHQSVQFLFKQLFNELEEKSLRRQFTGKLLKNFQKIIDSLEGVERTEELEERLELFPNLLSALLSFIENDQVEQVFECLIAIERQNFSRLT